MKEAHNRRKPHIENGRPEPPRGREEAGSLIKEYCMKVAAAVKPEGAPYQELTIVPQIHFGKTYLQNKRGPG